MLPPGMARRCRLGRRAGRLGKVYFSMHVRTTTILGFAAPAPAGRPALVAAAHPSLRRGAGRDRALAEAIRAAQPLSIDLAREIAECARLIKGYGDTHKRGLGNYRRITDEVIAPALAGRMTPRAAADAVANARVAALADPEGETLSKTLAAIAASPATLRHAAE